MPIRVTSSIKLARQQGHKPVGETFEPGDQLAGIGAELVIGDDRGDGGEEAERGGEQGFGDAGSDDGKAGVFGGGDGGEGVHDAPDGAEEADKGAGAADGGEEAEATFEIGALFGDGEIEGDFEAALQAAGLGRLLGVALVPFVHGGHEHGRKAIAGGMLIVAAQIG